jgi:hypothetical protein
MTINRILSDTQIVPNLKYNQSISVIICLLTYFRVSTKKIT